MCEIKPIVVEKKASAPLPGADLRAKMEEPLPVRIVAIADVVLPGLAELERASDDFYVGLLKMVRDEPSTLRIYRTETFRVIFQLFEKLIERVECRPLQIEIPSLGEVENQLVEREYPFEHVRGIMPGLEYLELLDPSGNMIQLMERREVF